MTEKTEDRQKIRLCANIDLNVYLQIVEYVRRQKGSMGDFAGELLTKEWRRIKK